VVLLIKLDKIHPSTTMWKTSSPARVDARELPELDGPPWPGPCGGKHQVVWDTFRIANWEGVQGPIVFAEGSKLKVKAPPGKEKFYPRVFESLLPDAGDDGSIHTDAYEACLALQNPRLADNPAETYAGLLFGISKDSGYLELLIDAAGRVSVVDSNPSPARRLLDWSRIDVIETGPRAINVLQVMVKGRSANLLVNGRKLDLPPIDLKNERSSIGFGSGSEPTRADAWKFLWIAATEAE